jgi:hypothetical protein
MQRKGKKRRKLGDLKDHVLGIKRKKRKSVLLFGKQDDFASFPPPPPLLLRPLIVKIILLLFLAALNWQSIMQQASEINKGERGR